MLYILADESLLDNRNKQGLEAFIQNRVTEIRRLVPADCWDHCSGKTNPADIPSRGLSSEELSASVLWKHGPSWLHDDLSTSPVPSEIPETRAKELKSSDVFCLVTPTSNVIQVSNIIDCHRFSSVHKLYRVTVYVLKFVSLLKDKGQPHLLTQNDLSKAKKLWISECQAALVKDKNFPMWETHFNLYLDENGLWRCQGRLENSNLSFGAKHPLMLARRHHYTELIVRDAHRIVQHSGSKDTLTQLRSQYWIVGDRSLVRSINHRCVTCRCYDGQPFHTPPPPPLPDFRVNKAPPFTYTGVDYAGPLFVCAQGDENNCKVWICLFTCCVTRAVHLELVTDMSAPTFLRCLKRFTARRGLPRKFVSDNGKAFQVAARTLKDMTSQSEFTRHLAEVGIEWTFNLEKAPWWGGLFERLVKLVKRCLRKIVGQAKFSFDELNTALVEVEAIVNSRPLTYISSDDVEEPLTPSHLLVGRRLLSLPDDLCYIVDKDDEEFTVTEDTLRKRAKNLNNVLNHFWTRWAKEYLQELHNAHRYPSKRPQSSTVREGDVVVVQDPDLPRGFWKVARVTGLIIGRDGLHRGAVLRVAARGEQATTLRRPLQLLYPLEINCSSDRDDQAADKVTEQNLPTHGDDEHPSSVDDSATKPLDQDELTLPDESVTEERNLRRAALKAREQFKQWSASLLDNSS